MKISKLITLLAVTICSLQTIAAASDSLKSTTVKTIADKRKLSTMKFNNFAYIFLGPELDPTKNRSVIKTDKFTFTAIGIDIHHKDDALIAAKEAVAGGAQIIELCGGFGPLWITKVSEAIHGQVPVGSVAYGPEARKPLIELLS